MSICLYARINRKCLNQDLLDEQINRYINEKNKGTECLYFKNMLNNGDINISFIEEKRPPYNIYDFSTCDKEFKYIQVIIFDIKKDLLSHDVYIIIIDFCKELREKILCNILITSDVYDEICLMKEGKIEWLNSVFR